MTGRPPRSELPTKSFSKAPTRGLRVASLSLAREPAAREPVDPGEHRHARSAHDYGFQLVLTRNQLLEVLRRHDDCEFSVPLQRLSVVTTQVQQEGMKTRMQQIGNAGSWLSFKRAVRFSELSSTMSFTPRRSSS